MSGQHKSQELTVANAYPEKASSRPVSLARERHALMEPEVVDAHYGRLFRAALSLTWDSHLAEEIVQETFLAAFRKLDGFSGKSSVFTWLYRIMLNKYRDHYRKRGLLRRLGFVRAERMPGQGRTISSNTPSPAAGLVISEERQFLKNAVDQLSEKLRVVVVMHYFDDLPLAEMAKVLNCRLSTVKSRLFEARKRLYKALKGKLKDGHENAVPRG